MDSRGAEKDEWNLALLCNLTSHVDPRIQRSTRDITETFGKL